MLHFQMENVSTNINSSVQKHQGGKIICSWEIRGDVWKAQR